MSKPTVAIFDFACCEGCQLQIVNLEEDILSLISVVQPVEWREAMTESADGGPVDIAIVEGSITRPEDEERLKKIRERAKVLVALGACATMGGVNKLKNNFADLDEVRRMVYADKGGMRHLDTAPTKALHEVVKVDLKIEGCPIDGAEFAHIVKSVALGKTPSIPDYPVCVECKKKGNLCRYMVNEICLGPVTRAGCGAVCPSGGGWCFGCRGYTPDANVKALADSMKHYGRTPEELKSRLMLFGSKQEPTNAF